MIVDSSGQGRDGTNQGAIWQTNGIRGSDYALSFSGGSMVVEPDNGDFLVGLEQGVGVRGVRSYDARGRAEEDQGRALVGLAVVIVGGGHDDVGEPVAAVIAATRAQADRELYRDAIRSMLLGQENLDIVEAAVDDLIVGDGEVVEVAVAVEVGAGDAASCMGAESVPC